MGIALVGLAAVISGCSSDQTASTDTEQKVIIVGAQNDYPPFTYADENNELTGFDVDCKGD